MIGCGRVLVGATYPAAAHRVAAFCLCWYSICSVVRCKVVFLHFSVVILFLFCAFWFRHEYITEVDAGMHAEERSPLEARLLAWKNKKTSRSRSRLAFCILVSRVVAIESSPSLYVFRLVRCVIFSSPHHRYVGLS